MDRGGRRRGTPRRRRSRGGRNGVVGIVRRLRRGDRAWGVLWLAALLLWAVARGPGAAHAGTTGRIAGRILDAKKQPLAGVTVGMVGVQLGAITDETGQFNIINIPAGPYTVRASLVGYRPVVTTNIIVSADETTRLDLTLEEA